MKTKPIIFLLALAIILFVAGCKDQNDPVISDISGSLVNNSECKSFISGNLKFDTADTLSCVHYTYNPLNHTLIIVHYNAGFNCCPGELSVGVSTVEDTIFITEFEEEQMCNCNCLFDLDIELNNVNQENYMVKFIEPYAEGQDPLLFEMDLSNSSEGEYCVVRKGYPWGK
jgi:hypothetical protein